MYATPGSGAGFALAPEVTPSTRTSNALGLDYKYYLPWRAALDLQYRYFQDTWHIRAQTAQIGYTQPWHNFTFDGDVRFYTQTHADFYSDLSPRRTSRISSHAIASCPPSNSLTIGTGVSYQFRIPYAPFLTKSTANFRFDHFMFDYKDFRDALLIDPAKGGRGGHRAAVLRGPQRGAAVPLGLLLSLILPRLRGLPDLSNTRPCDPASRPRHRCRTDRR